MQQLQWNSMISQHQGGPSASSAAASSADHHQQTCNTGTNKAATPAIGGLSMAKSPSQMSLQEILASSK